MNKVFTVGHCDKNSFICSLDDCGQVLIRKLENGKLGIFCNVTFSGDEMFNMDLKKNIVDHWPMPKVTRADSYFDAEQRAKTAKDGSVLSGLRTIQRQIQQELFESLNHELQEKGFELEYANA